MELNDYFSEICDECGVRLEVMNNEYSCPDCGKILSISVAESQDRTIKPPVHTIDFKKTISDKLHALNASAENKNITPFPQCIIDTTLHIYYMLRECIKEVRTQQTNQRLAACLYYASIQHNILRNKKEICMFFGARKNFGGAIELIELLIAEGKMVMTPTVNNPRTAFVNYLCIMSGIEDTSLRRQIINTSIQLCNTSIDKFIPISAVYESRITATSYIAMRLYHIKVELDVVCKLAKIHKDTIQKVVNAIKKEYREFEPLTESSR